MSNMASTESAPLDGMRLRLLEIAERLFAEQGVEAAPMQQIVAESGQRNRAALNYYFGSRRDLVAAMVDWRMAEINRLRHIELDRLEAEGMASSVSGLIRAGSRPLTDVIRYTPWGQHYVRVLAQCLYNPALAAYDMVSQQNLTALVRLHKMLMQALPDIPGPVLAIRLSWSSDLVVQSLARWSQSQHKDQPQRVLEDMFSYIVAGVSAPAGGAGSDAESIEAGSQVGLARRLKPRAG